MPSWMTEKLVWPCLAAIGGFAFGIFGDEFKSRVFPPEKDAVISEVHFLRDVTLRNYLKGTGRSLSNHSQADLSQPGTVVFATVHTTGYKGKDLVFSGSGEAGLGITDFEQAVDGSLRETSMFTPGADKAVNSPDLWVAVDCTEKSYKVLLTVTHKLTAIVRRPSGDIPRTRCPDTAAARETKQRGSRAR